jgi:hypothetical protein
MKFIKIFIAAIAVFSLQFTMASAATTVKAPGTFLPAKTSSPQQQQKHRIRRHHLRHRPHRHNFNPK